MKFEKESERLYKKLIEEEVNGEKHYYRKREVYPIFDKEGNINWKYFLIGNWKSFLLVLLIVLITLGVIYEYISNVKIGAECIARENLLKNLIVP